MNFTHRAGSADRGSSMFDKTSRKGFWSGGGENLTQAASAVRVKVLAKNIGPKGDAHVCKAAATSRPLA